LSHFKRRGLLRSDAFDHLQKLRLRLLGGVARKKFFFALAELERRLPQHSLLARKRSGLFAQRGEALLGAIDTVYWSNFGSFTAGGRRCIREPIDQAAGQQSDTKDNKRAAIAIS